MRDVPRWAWWAGGGVFTAGLVAIALAVAIRAARRAEPTLRPEPAESATDGRSEIEKEAMRIMNERGAEVVSISLVNEMGNRYRGQARRSDGGGYKVTVTSDGRKIFVEWE